MPQELHGSLGLEVRLHGALRQRVRDQQWLRGAIQPRPEVHRLLDVPVKCLRPAPGSAGANLDGYVETRRVREGRPTARALPDRERDPALEGVLVVHPADAIERKVQPHRHEVARPEGQRRGGAAPAPPFLRHEDEPLIR